MDPELREYLDKLSEGLSKSHEDTRSDLKALKTLLQGQTRKLDELSGNSCVKDVEITHDNVADDLTQSEETADIVPGLAASAASAKPFDIDTTGVVPLMPTTHSTKCPSRDATASTSVFTMDSTPTSATTTVDVTPVLAAPVATNNFADPSRPLQAAVPALIHELRVLRPMPWPSFKYHSEAVYSEEPCLGDQAIRHCYIEPRPWPYFVPACETETDPRFHSGLELLLFGDHCSLEALLGGHITRTCLMNKQKELTPGGDTSYGEYCSALSFALHTTSILMQKTVRSSELNLLLISHAPSLLDTPGVKKNSSSLTATGSLQLHFIVFSGNSKWWSYCWFPGCTYEAYNCWRAQCYELGAATSVLREFIGTSNCYLHFGAVQNLRTLVCCGWEILWLHSCGYHSDGYCWMTWDPGLMSHCILISCCPDRTEGHTMTCATRRYSLNSEDPGSACLLWMVSDTVGERCNSEGSSENHDSILTCSHETVLINMVEHQLSALLLTCQVQIITRWVKPSSSVKPTEFLLQWYVASSALSPDHLFERELCVTVNIVLAVFTSQEASPGINMQSHDFCLHAWAGTLVWHVGLINLNVFYQNFTDMAHDSTWYFTMQLKMIWDPGIGLTPTAYAHLVILSFTYACQGQLLEVATTDIVNEVPDATAAISLEPAEMFEPMAGLCDKAHDATADVKEHKGAHESVIPLSITPSTWYEQLFAPRDPCSISLHVQMVLEKHMRVINSGLRPAWPPPVQINFNALCGHYLLEHAAVCSISMGDKLHRIIHFMSMAVQWNNGSHMESVLELSVEQSQGDTPPCTILVLPWLGFSSSYKSYAWSPSVSSSKVRTQGSVQLKLPWPSFPCVYRPVQFEADSSPETLFSSTHLMDKHMELPEYYGHVLLRQAPEDLALLFQWQLNYDEHADVRNIPRHEKLLRIMGMSAHWRFLSQEEFKGSGRSEFHSNSVVFATPGSSKRLSELNPLKMVAWSDSLMLSVALRVFCAYLSGHQSIILLLNGWTSASMWICNGCHLALLYYTKLGTPWDPGGHALCPLWKLTRLFQGGWGVIAITVDFVQGSVNRKYHFGFDNDYFLGISFDWVAIDHDYYNHVIQVNPDSDYHHDFELVKEYRVQWDPGGSWWRRLGVKPNFKEGGMLGALLTCMYMGLPLGPTHGSGRSAQLLIPARRQRPGHPVGSRTARRLPLSPTSGSLPLLLSDPHVL